MKGQAKLFFFADVVFVLVFAICSLIYANHDAILILLVVVGLITVYPLYIYVDAYTREDEVLTVTWYLEHFNMLMLYCLVRAFMLFGFFSWVLIDMSGISVTAVVSHFPVFVIVSLFIMFITFLLLVVLTLRLVPLQRRVVYEFIEKNETEDEVETKTIQVPSRKRTEPTLFREFI